MCKNRKKSILSLLICALIVTGMTGADVKASAAADADGESINSISETEYGRRVFEG